MIANHWEGPVSQEVIDGMQDVIRDFGVLAVPLIPRDARDGTFRGVRLDGLTPENTRDVLTALQGAGFYEGHKGPNPACGAIVLRASGDTCPHCGWLWR